MGHVFGFALTIPPHRPASRVFSRELGEVSVQNLHQRNGHSLALRTARVMSSTDRPKVRGVVWPSIALRDDVIDFEELDGTTYDAPTVTLNHGCSKGAPCPRAAPAPHASVGRAVGALARENSADEAGTPWH